LLWSTANLWGTPHPMMNNHYQKTPMDVYLIGEAATAILSVEGQGTVLASISGAVYLQNQLGELCWLIPMDAPMHQRGIKIDGQVPRFSPGSRYQAKDHSLAIDSEYILNFRHLQIWKEPTVTGKGILPVSALSGSLGLFAEQLFSICHPAGLGCLIKPTLHLTTQQENGLIQSFENKIAEKAWPSIIGLMQAFNRNDGELYIQHVKSLIGLGEGLTPSGDDFLGGFFYSMHLLQNHSFQTVKMPISTYSDFILRMKPLTNLLSFTIFVDHIAGHSVEPLHQLAGGILTGALADELIFHAKRLISLGHSSGWDILAGFVTGMSFAFAR
jgi:hypothetical protein